MCYHGNIETVFVPSPTTIDTAHVVCRQIGYPNALQLTSDPVHGLGTGLVVLEPWCDGNETRIEQCHHFGWRKYYDCTRGFYLYQCVQEYPYTSRCDHTDDIAVECKGEEVLLAYVLLPWKPIEIILL